MSKSDAPTEDTTTNNEDLESVDMLEKSEREDHIRRRFATTTAVTGIVPISASTAPLPSSTATSTPASGEEKPAEKKPKAKKRDIFDVSLTVILSRLFYLLF